MVGALRAGDMRVRVRDFDWAATPLGPRGGWPAALTWSVDLVLASGFPMAVRWGPDQVVIYNDAYAALLGERHPAALGKPLREVWPELLDQLGPLSKDILSGKSGSFFAEDHPWTVQRHGVPEQAYFTVSYSPLPDSQAPNGIGGILVTVVETTGRVRDEKMLRGLSERLEAEVQLRTRERDRIWAVSEDLLGVSNFDGYFTSVNPAWSHLLGWSEDEIKALHVSELRHPGRRAGGKRRARPPGARRADRAHGKPLPSSRRFLALDRLDPDRRCRPHLRCRPPRHHGKRSRRTSARQRAAIAPADGGRRSTTPSSCSIRTAT